MRGLQRPSFAQGPSATRSVKAHWHFDQAARDSAEETRLEVGGKRELGDARQKSLDRNPQVQPRDIELLGTGKNRRIAIRPAKVVDGVVALGLLVRPAQSRAGAIAGVMPIETGVISAHE